MHCPLINSECKGGGCAFWNNKACVIVTYLSSNNVEMNKQEDSVGRQEADYADILAGETRETLAAKMVEIAKEKYSDELWVNPNAVLAVYMEQNGIKQFGISPDAERLILQSLDMANKTIIKLWADREAVAIKEILPECVKWAQGNGLQNLRQTDVAAYLMDSSKKLSKNGQRSLYALVNVELRKR
jgi:hypothetical protein